MLATGWTADTLARQPASVVRSLIHRLFVAKVWSPDVMAAARTATPDRRSFATLSDWADARRSKRAAVEYAEAIEAALWPEDDDG